MMLLALRIIAVSILMCKGLLHECPYGEQRSTRAMKVCPNNPAHYRCLPDGLCNSQEICNNTIVPWNFTSNAFFGNVPILIRRQMDQTGVALSQDISFILCKYSLNKHIGIEAFNGVLSRLNEKFHSGYSPKLPCSFTDIVLSNMSSNCSIESKCMHSLEPYASDFVVVDPTGDIVLKNMSVAYYNYTEWNQYLSYVICLLEKGNIVHYPVTASPLDTEKRSSEKTTTVLYVAASILVIIVTGICIYLRWRKKSRNGRHEGQTDPLKMNSYE